MSTNAKQHWPPGLSPTQSEAVPSLRPAYSDRTSAMMALFCELAHDTFVADQSPADQAGAPTVAGGAGRKELKRRLEAGSFRLVQVFNKDQAFLAVREGHFAILAFPGTEGKELLDTDLNLRLVPLPGVSGVMVHCGFLEVFSRCKTEIEAAVTSFALRRDRYADFLYNMAAIVLVTLRTSKLLINDDHMIWNYRKRLEEIAAARTAVPTSP